MSTDLTLECPFAASAAIEEEQATLFAPTTTPTFVKEIVYDRETRDYALYLDGQIVGFARTHHEGETTLDELVHSILTHVAPEPAPVPDALDLDVAPIPRCFDCKAVLADTGRCEECDDRAYASLVAETPRYTIACTCCGEPAGLLEPHGAFCGGCYKEAGAEPAGVNWGS